MKKVLIIGVSIFVCIIIGIFLIRDAEEDTEVTKDKTKVGCVLIGSKADKSWGQSHYEAMMSCAKELNLEVMCRENVPGDESCLETIESLIDSGCEIVMCDSYSHGEWIVKAADLYPDIYFLHATGVAEKKNLTSYFGRIYQMRYLSGIVAGMQTETQEIGYVAAFNIDEVNRGINAFALGVRSVRPEANVYVKWIESWTDDDRARAATKSLFKDHDIDVLAMHTDSIAPLQEADAAGVWSIGYNMDNGEEFPGTYLTAPVWTWENFYKSRILECLQGKFRGDHYWEGVDSNIVALAEFTDNVKPGIKEVVEKEYKRLQSGEFDVFYGPIKDKDGVVRINANESMTDTAMLNEFDWYVEGVVLDE